MSAQAQGRFHLRLLWLRRAKQRRTAQYRADQFAVRSGIETPKGAVLVALFDSEAAYDAGRPVASGMIPVRGGTAARLLQGLKPGRYAFKAFHDLDGDFKMAARWLIAPSINLAARATELHVFDARRVDDGPLCTWRADVALPAGFTGGGARPDLQRGWRT